MAEKFVRPAAAGGSAGNTGNSPASPWTVQHACQNVNPGDTVTYADGTYADVAADRLDAAANPAFDSGTVGNVILHRATGTGAIMVGRIDLQDRRYLELRGFKCRRATTSNQAWLRTGSPAARNITLRNMEFDSPGNNIEGGSGIFLQNGTQDFRIIGCTFKDWFGGDMISAFTSTRVLIAECDFSQARGKHSDFSFENSQRITIRDSYIRNNQGRAGVCTWDAGGPTSRIFILGCAFVDCDYNGTDFNPNIHLPSVVDDGQELRFSVDRGTIRDCLFIHHNKGPDTANVGALGLNLYGTVERATNLRIYHSTFYDNYRSHISLTRNTNTAGFLVDRNFIFNNVFKKRGVANGDAYAIKVSRAEITSWDTWKVENNLFSETGSPIHLRSATPTDYTVAGAQTAFPTVFAGNLNATALFNNEAYFVDDNNVPHAYTLANLEEMLDSYRLAPASPGFALGREITRVSLTLPLPDTAIPVIDALPFYDGNGIEGEVGDEILVGPEGVRVVTLSDDRTLVVDRAIPIRAGDRIYLRATGSAPASGLIQAAQVAPPAAGAGGGGGEGARRRARLIPSAYTLP